MCRLYIVLGDGCVIVLQLIFAPIVCEGCVLSWFGDIVLGLALFSLVCIFTFIQSELPRRIPWNQTSDVHRGSILTT